MFGWIAPPLGEKMNQSPSHLILRRGRRSDSHLSQESHFCYHPRLKTIREKQVMEKETKTKKGKANTGGGAVGITLGIVMAFIVFVLLVPMSALWLISTIK